MVSPRQAWSGKQLYTKGGIPQRNENKARVRYCFLTLFLCWCNVPASTIQNTRLPIGWAICGTPVLAAMRYILRTRKATDLALYMSQQIGDQHGS